MKKELKTFVKFIKEFEDSLEKEYCFEGDIWSRSQRQEFPKKGFLNNYNYRFHGAGCTIKRNDIICEYSIAPLNEFKIKFSYWGLYQFIKTHPELRTRSRGEIEEGVEELVVKGFISRFSLEGIERKLGPFQVPDDLINQIMRNDFGNM